MGRLWAPLCDNKIDSSSVVDYNYFCPWSPLIPELQKDYFCTVSGFSTEKCPNHVFGEFSWYMRHKSNPRILFQSFLIIWSNCVNRLLFLHPFQAKFGKINSNYLIMSGFSSRNLRYPRYQDTDLLQLCLILLFNVLLRDDSHFHDVGSASTLYPSLAFKMCSNKLCSLSKIHQDFQSRNFK